MLWSGEGDGVVREERCVGSVRKECVRGRRECFRGGKGAFSEERVR